MGGAGAVGGRVEARDDAHGVALEGLGELLLHRLLALGARLGLQVLDVLVVVLRPRDLAELAVAEPLPPELELEVVLLELVARLRPARTK